MSWGRDDTLVVYRSLGPPASAHFLGHQTKARFLVGKFTQEGSSSLWSVWTELKPVSRFGLERIAESDRAMYDQRHQHHQAAGMEVGRSGAWPARCGSGVP